MLDDWAGVAIIVTVQFITFFFTKRKLDRLDEAISRVEKALAEMREQTVAMHTELTKQLAAMKTELAEQIATNKTDPPPPCCATNPKCTAAPKSGQTR